MRFPCPVTHGADTVAMTLIPNIHDYFATVISPVGFTIESIGMPVRWPPGIAAGTAKIAASVRHLGSPIAQEAHDLGPLLWHLTIFPSPDPLNVSKHLLESKCRFMFSNGEVNCEGKPTACTSLQPMPMPMSACGWPVDLPIMTAPTNAGNSAIMGVHLVDVVAGWAAIVVQMLWELYDYYKDIAALLVLARGGGGAPMGFFKFRKWLGRISRILGGDPLGGDHSGSNGIVVGLVRLVGRRAFGYHGPGLTVQRGNTEVNVVLNEDGSGRVSVERRMGPQGVLGAGVVDTWDAAGNHRIVGGVEAAGHGIQGIATSDPSAEGTPVGDTGWRLGRASETDSWTGESRPIEDDFLNPQ